MFRHVEKNFMVRMDKIDAVSRHEDKSKGAVVHLWSVHDMEEPFWTLAGRPAFDFWQWCMQNREE